MSGQPARRALLAVVGAAAAAGVSAAAWTRWRPFRVAVDGPSMAPTFLAGDFLVCVRVRRPRVGDVVVVEHPDRRGYEMLKRVSRPPEESVERLWIIGDDPRSSTDSRHFGAIQASSVAGIVRLRYWPPSRFALFRRPRPPQSDDTAPRRYSETSLAPLWSFLSSNRGDPR